MTLFKDIIASAISGMLAKQDAETILTETKADIDSLKIRRTISIKHDGGKQELFELKIELSPRFDSRKATRGDVSSSDVEAKVSIGSMATSSMYTGARQHAANMAIAMTKIQAEMMMIEDGKLELWTELKAHYTPDEF